MTQTRLFRNVAVVSALLVLLVLIALFVNPFYKILKDFSAIFLAIAAAYLGYCFQRRQAFLSSLRELWHKCIEAKAELVEYTHHQNPDRDSFNKAHRAISTAIDMVRGVYCNVGESKTLIGLYPFEPLHDMRKALDRIGFQAVTSERQHAERVKIMQAWNAFRFYFLQEFSIPTPRYFITEQDARDPRRKTEIVPEAV